MGRSEWRLAMNESLNSVGVGEPQAPVWQPETASAAPPQTVRTGRAGSMFAWLGRALPTLFVLGAIGALGYWGHHTGWTLPKFSALTGNGHVHPADWCVEHGVPESQRA